MSLREKASSGFFWSFFIQSGFQIVNFIVSIILARILTPQDFGLIGIVLIFITIGKVLTDGGLSSSLIRTRNPNGLDYSSVFFMNLLCSIIIYLIIYILAPHIAIFFNHSELKGITRVLCLTFIINAFSTVQSVMLNKNLQFKKQFLLQLPSLVISSILGILLAYNGFGVWSLVWKEISFAIIATVQLWIYSKFIPSIRLIKLEKLKFHFRFGYKITLTGILNSVCSNIYNLIIGKFFSVAQLGYYTRAKSIQELPIINLESAISRVAFPLMANISDDDVHLKSIYRRLMVQIVFWTTPALIISGVLATLMFHLLLTDKWIHAVPYYQILVLAGLMYPVHRYNLNICYVKGRSDMVLKLTIIQNALMLLGSISAIWFGIFGLLWSIVGANLIIMIVNAYLSGKLINYTWKEQFKDILKFWVLGLVSGLLAMVINMLLDMKSDIFRFLFSTISSLLVYFIMVYIVSRSPIIEFKAFVYQLIRLH